MRALYEQSRAIARKELRTYFGSPMATIFVGAFLIASLFSFFWADAFFARNIADVRPLFRRMPVLMIFLVGALTMRQWSEEQRAGTLEVLLTLPVRRLHLVLGKFLAAMALLGLSLALTLFLPITVSLLGELDWGPVVGGYLAALLLSAAYAAAGLFVSSRTDNQIVALIATVLLCGVLYLVGTGSITGLMGDAPGEILRAIGTGSRFESIERGVIDLRDLIYYLSLAVLFLLLNVFSLDMKRWGKGIQTALYRRNAFLSVILVTANLLALNAWLFPVHGLRADLTAQGEYSLSPATLALVRTPQEPLLIRGYFSERTHPLLAPLVPTIRDMLSEYQVASGGKIKVEILDPKDNEELEAEANQTYGIRPTPFRIEGRYEASVINSYFDLLIRYGDQHVILGFQDLIEVESLAGGQINVRLRNLEYDLTRSIKKVVYGFQSLDAVLAGMAKPAKLTAFITTRTLPDTLQDVPQRLQKVAAEIQENSGGKFTFGIVDPDAPDSPVTRQTLLSTYGLRPIPTSLFSADSYYLHMLLQVGDKTDPLYPSGEMSEAALRTEIESGLKRAAPGFLKAVGLWLPPSPDLQLTGGQQPISTWNMLQEQLATSYDVKLVDLKPGYVPAGVDVLVLVAPQGMNDSERFAVDQYLMRGGAVVVAGGNTILSPQQFGNGILLETVQDGLREVLASYGVKVGEGLVMDPQNEPFPVQVQREVGTMSVVEVREISYPFFVDVRRDGMSKDSPIVANLPAATLQWASPLEVDPEKNRERQVVTLLQSSAKSWLRASQDTQPDLKAYPELGFPVEGEQKARPLAVSIKGSLESYFKGRASPLQTSQALTGTEQAPAGAKGDVALGVIEASPPSSRLVVIGSAEFLDDTVLQISRNLSQDRYLLNLQFLQNAVDWCLEDEDLLTIRSRGTYARLLRPMDKGQQSTWEGLNYVAALGALVALALVWNTRQRSERPMPWADSGEER